MPPARRDLRQHRIDGNHIMYQTLDFEEVTRALAALVSKRFIGFDNSTVLSFVRICVSIDSPQLKLSPTVRRADRQRGAYW